MTVSLHLKQHDLKPDLRVRLLDEATPVDLTNATSVHMVMSSRRTGVVIDAPMTILDQTDPDTLGVVVYAWSPGDTDTTGEFQAEFRVTWPSARQQTFPASSYLTVVIQKELNAGGGPTIG
jgi:hypothetical protein